MSTRDELANLIAKADAQEVGAMDPQTVGTMYGHLADAVLAAGYSRPRVVETIEGLDALPTGSVVLDGDTVPYERVGSEWIGCDAGDVYRDGRLLRLPATVVHLPEEKP
ncbi:hypothetical protein [Prescottella equi]|uniref:hypothetical protein n=1 Tax=Rhodococcus hoagii TaxID=43767 RepID=UPI001A04A8B5|nr:hypothetical protein [Prescottella equi]MBM4592356.1 hypothetical protein [Prescottella equi]MBP0094885.1 hypothetical protein [Prescottella equi]NKU46699.1 hypothetical protein [Prescottella equi]NKW25633.1 hypothetical protein [Prescottella equi]